MERDDTPDVAVDFLNLTMGIVGTFQVFAAGYLLQAAACRTPPLLRPIPVAQRPPILRMGHAAALAWVLFFIIMGLTALTFGAIGSRVYYEEAG